MQDPLITLRGALSSGWALAGDLAAANLKFTTGWYDKDFGNLQIGVTLLMESEAPAQLGSTTILVTSEYEVNIWVKAKNVTDKGVGKAKNYKWDMKQEVKRILLANKTGLTDLSWVILNGDGQDLDEPDEVPPLMRYRYSVTVMYYLSA